MEYSFRPNLFLKHRSVRLSADCIELVDRNGRVTRSEDLTRIKSLHEFNGGVVEAPNDRRFTLAHCQIRFSNGGSVLLKSGSYAGPNVWNDHGTDYRAFMDDLKNRLAQRNPETPIYVGSRGVVILWYLIGLCSVGLLLLAFFVLGNVLFFGKSVADVVVLVGSCLLFGTIGIMAAINQTRLNRPDQTTARESIQQR